jgi:hypothetical protein
LTIGQNITSNDSDTNVSANTRITAFGPPSGVTPNTCDVKSAGTGGTGTYTVNNSQNVTIESMRIVSTSQYKANQCKQAVAAANAAKTAGTTIYSIGYGIASGGCSTDSSTLSPLTVTTTNACQTMMWISGTSASNSPPATPSSTNPLPYFYKDTTSINTTTCKSSNSSGGLSKLFSDIYETFGSRILPDDAS